MAKSDAAVINPGGEAKGGKSSPNYGGDQYMPKDGLEQGIVDCEPIGHVKDHDTKGRSQKPVQPKVKLRTDRGDFTCY